MDEKLVLLTQSGLRREKKLARELAQGNHFGAAAHGPVHFKRPAINIPNDDEADRMTLSFYDMGVDPKSHYNYGQCNYFACVSRW